MFWHALLGVHSLTMLSDCCCMRICFNSCSPQVANKNYIMFQFSSNSKSTWTWNLVLHKVFISSRHFHKTATLANNSVKTVEFRRQHGSRAFGSPSTMILDITSTDSPLSDLWYDKRAVTSFSDTKIYYIYCQIHTHTHTCLLRPKLD